MTAPDANWIPFLKMTFGFILLVILAGLVCVIGLGNVKQESSYGLGEIVGSLLTLSGGFAQWCFRASKDEN